VIPKQKAIIFDMDGVIANTEPLKAEAHVATVRQLGGNVSAQLYAKVMGQSQETVSATFIKSSMIRCDLDTYTKIFRRVYYELLDEKLEFIPGMPNFLQILANRGYSLALVSSSYLEAIRKILTILKIDDLFKLLVSADDVKTKKPSPEPYLLALQRLKVTSQNALVFEDSEAGIISAHDSGILVVAVRHNLNITHDFSSAVYTIESFVDTSFLIRLIDKILQ